MRFLLGLILGSALTIALAYFHDTQMASPDATTVAGRPMVNWDVVDHDWQQVTGRVRHEWNRLAANRT
jgi:hypothetical protein